jgi:hypothetical protein
MDPALRYFKIQADRTAFDLNRVIDAEGNRIADHDIDRELAALIELPVANPRIWQAKTLVLRDFHLSYAKEPLTAELLRDDKDIQAEFVSFLGYLGSLMRWANNNLLMNPAGTEIIQAYRRQVAKSFEIAANLIRGLKQLGAESVKRLEAMYRFAAGICKSFNPDYSQSIANLLN